MNILILGIEDKSIFTENGFIIVRDPSQVYLAIITSAQNVDLLPVELEAPLFIQLSGKPSDIKAKAKYKFATFFREPIEIIDSLKKLNDDVEDLEVVEENLDNLKSFVGITYSNKGGVGKTTCARSLALSLNDLNVKTVLLDFDFGGANQASFFNISEPFNYLSGEVNEEILKKSIVKVKGNLHVLPIPNELNMPQIKENDLVYIVEYMKRNFQAVIIDTMIKPHEHEHMFPVFEMADLIYAVVNQAKITKDETSEFAPALIYMGVKAKNIRIIINDYSAKQTSTKDIVQAFNRNLKLKSNYPKLTAVFPHDWDEHLKAMNKGTYLDKIEWRKVSEEILRRLNSEVEILPDKPIGIFEKITNIFKK